MASVLTAGEPQLWKLGESRLQIREGASCHAEAAVIDTYEDVWANLGIEASRPLGIDEGRYEVRASRWVGVAQLPKRQGHQPQIEVLPKMDLDLFFLGDYAFGRERDRLQDAKLAAFLNVTKTAPSAHLLAWFLAELESFVLRHLRRDYVVRREVFEGRIRGRLLLGEYVQRYIASAQSHRVPCQFFDFTQDNLANQVLKRTATELRRLASLLPLPKARADLTRQADRLLPYFNSVSDRRVYPADFNRLRLRASLRHYEPIIHKCRAVLSREYLAPTLGPHAQDAFLWDAAFLFERALRGILRTTPGLQLRPRKGRASIIDASGEVSQSSAVMPDFVIDAEHARFLLDAKYKETGVDASVDDVLEVDISTANRIRVRRSDIYQAIAYAQHSAYMPGATALIYPIALLPGQTLPQPYKVTGFVQPVSLLFINVGQCARESLAQFRENVLLLAEPGASPV